MLPSGLFTLNIHKLKFDSSDCYYQHELPNHLETTVLYLNQVMTVNIENKKVVSDHSCSKNKYSALSLLLLLSLYFT